MIRSGITARVTAVSMLSPKNTKSYTKKPKPPQEMKVPMKILQNPRQKRAHRKYNRLAALSNAANDEEEKDEE
ncbi:hypothetical protein JTB14_019449 [Gonioctena quinquepunctata]|nr:hypothetical protein JTB14_019449 [Gonioctena quinquepunctata]